MKEVDIRQIAVNNHIYNLKKQELKNTYPVSSVDNYKDGERKVKIRKIIKSGSYVLDYRPLLTELFSLNIFYAGFLNFLQRNYLKDKKSYTTATGNLILQDIINVMYLKEKVNFQKYSYILSETNETYITDPDEQLNKELVLKLPTDITMLTPFDEIINAVSVIGFEGLLTIIELVEKVNIQTV